MNDNVNSLIEEKGKKSKFPVKKAALGIFSFLILLSTKPSVEYSIARKEAENSKYIANVLNDTNLSREQKIAQIYKTALMSNNKISNDLKQQLMEAFTTEVIEYAGCFFTDETIKNMYAVAKTEDVREMNNFEKKYGWWDGDYISYLNLISVESIGTDIDKTLLAHEQMHAILKKGYSGNGLMNGIYGYGINEGATTSSVKFDTNYPLQTKTFDLLGLILGYEPIFKTYTNFNLSELIQILCQYIPPQEAKELIVLLDIDIFRGYTQVFMERNGIKYDKDKMEKRKLNSKNRVNEILTDIFESKNGCKMEDSQLGRLIMGSYNYISDDNISFSEPIYTLNFEDANSIRINITHYDMIQGVTQMIINSQGEKADYINNTELQKELASKLGVNQVAISGWHWRDSKHVVVTILDVEYVVSIEQLDSFDYQKKYEELKTRVNEYNQKIPLEVSYEDER